MQGLQLDKDERKCGNERENRIECSTMSHFFGEWNQGGTLAEINGCASVPRKPLPKPTYQKIGESTLAKWWNYSPEKKEKTAISTKYSQYKMQAANTVF